MSPTKASEVISNICAICIKPMNPHEDSHVSRCGAIASSSFSSATMSLHFLHHSHKRLCRFAHPTTRSLVSSDLLALSPAILLLASSALLSEGVVDGPGVCPHVPRHVLARVGHSFGLGLHRLTPACLTCVEATFGLARSIRPVTLACD